MAHMITTSDNLFTVREPAWHGLGTVLDDYPTREQAQQIAHPWEPVEVPVYVKEPTITVHDHTPNCPPWCDVQDDLGTAYGEVPEYKAVQRSDNGATLGVVNDTLGIVTNSEMWDVAEAVGKVAGGPRIRYETAGSLEGGSKVWVLLRFDEPLMIAGDPNGGTVAYFALQNSHNGSGSFRGQGINTRIVCQNTSSAADTESRRNGMEFVFRHTSGIRDRIEEAKEAVEMWRDGVVMWREAMEHLATVRVTAEQREWFVQQFQPMPPEHLISDRVRANVERAREELRGIFASPTQEGIGLTSYGLAQAGFEWSQHFRRTRGKDQRSRMESHFKRAVLDTKRLGPDIVALATEAARV